MFAACALPQGRVLTSRSHTCPLLVQMSFPMPLHVKPLQVGTSGAAAAAGWLGIRDEGGSANTARPPCSLEPSSFVPRNQPHGRTQFPSLPAAVVGAHVAHGAARTGTACTHLLKQLVDLGFQLPLVVQVRFHHVWVEPRQRLDGRAAAIRRRCAGRQLKLRRLRHRCKRATKCCRWVGPHTGRERRRNAAPENSGGDTE